MANKLVLQLLADSNGLLKGLNDAQRSLDRFVQAAGGAGTAIGGPLNQALAAFAGLAKGGGAAAGVLAGGFAAAATAAVTLTLSAGQQVEAMDHLSQRTGIALQTLQRWSVVMAENDFQAESLTAGMRTLSTKITEARNPASAAASTFEEMGLSIASLGSTEDVIRAVADRFAAMPDGVDKAQLAVTLFGKAGLELIPILNRGSAAFDESAKASERFGVVLSTQQIKALEAADDAADRLGVALQGLKMQLGATFAPAVTAGVTALTEGIAALTRITQNYGAALEQIKKDHPVISSLSPAIASAMAAAKASQMPLPSGGGGSPGGPTDSHVSTFAAASGAQQEKLGQAILTRNLAMIQHNAAAGKSEERRGADIVRSTQIAVRAMEEEEAVRVRSEGAYQAFLAHRIIEESQANLKAEGNLQEHLGRKIVMEEQANQLAEGRNQEHLGQFIVDQAMAAEKARSAWQQQLETIVNSNTFSVGQIVTGWTSGLANAIVNFQNFGQTMTQIGKQTAATLLQTILNFGVQQAAQWALQSSSTLAIKTAESAAVLGINTAKNAAIVAGDAAGATATVSIWAGAGAAMVGTFGTITGAIMGLITGTIIPALVSAGTAVITFLSSIAAALDVSIFGAPFSIPVWAAVGLVGAALGVIAAFAFADGGIATGPTMGMIGEAGSSEAVIPLNKRGAAFMRETLGMGGTGSNAPIHTHVFLDSREIAVAIADPMMKALRGKGLPA